MAKDTLRYQYFSISAFRYLSISQVGKNSYLSPVTCQMSLITCHLMHFSQQHFLISSSCSREIARNT
mgnify:CR=1 FL=1|jgi:hypothetical protein